MKALLVRPYTESDKPELSKLLAEVWRQKRSVEEHVARRWWWQWDSPPLYVVDDPSSSRLVGVCAYLPFTLRDRGRERSCAWFVDFYVLAAFQGQGLGRRLTQAVQGRFELTASLSQTEMAWRVFDKLGWRPRAPVSLQMQPLPRWIPTTTSRDLRISRWTVSRDSAIKGDLDALWVTLRDVYSTIAVRDGEALLRRFAASGDRQYTLLSCHRRDACVGYMAVRALSARSGDDHRGPGLIVDYLTVPDDRQVFSALLSEGVCVLREADVRRIYCLTTSAAQRQLLRSRGFLAPDTQLLGRFLQGQLKWLTYFVSHDVDAIDPAGWFLTLADCDLDYAWY